MVLLAGFDDAGRGPVLGPMVIAGIAIDEKDEHLLKELGAKDSKLLSPNQREALFEKIKSMVKSYHIEIISPQEIDKAIDSTNSNLNDIEALAFAKCVNALKPDIAIIDCPSTNIPAYTEHLKLYLKVSPKIMCEHKADFLHPCVSAASILAKVTRDREIEKIQKKIGVDFGSLSYNEEVLIEHNNKIYLKKIGQLVEEGPWDVNVFSFDKKNYNIKKHKVTGFIEHPKTSIYNIELERGKYVKLSKNHPIFCLNEDLDLIPKKIEEVGIGKHIALAGKINECGKLNKLDITDLLKYESTKKSPLYIKVKKDFIKKNRLKIVNLLMAQNYERTSYYSYLKENYLPLNIFTKLNSKIKGMVCSRESRLQLDRYLKIDKNLMWFLGIYLAEGWLADYNVMVASQEKRAIAKIKKFAQQYKINWHHNKIKGDIGLSSILLVKIIKCLVKGKNAYTKEVPEFIFSTDKKMIKEFLDGLYYGDGYTNNSGQLEIELRSKRIIEQLQWLHLIIGSFSTNSKRYTKKAFITRIMSKNSNSLCPYNLPPVAGLYAKKIREDAGLTRLELANKCKINASYLARIEQGKDSSIQINCLKKIMAVIPNKKLSKLINSEICWLKIKKIEFIEEDKVYDLGVAYPGVENFLGGQSGIILHNSGYPADPFTKEFLKNNWQKYPEIFRHTWATYRAYSKEEFKHKGKNKNKSLGDF